MGDFTLNKIPTNNIQLPKLATPIPKNLAGTNIPTVPLNTPVNSKDDSFIRRTCEAIADFSKFEAQYWNPNDPCFRLAVNKRYVEILKGKQ